MKYTYLGYIVQSYYVVYLQHMGSYIRVFYTRYEFDIYIACVFSGKVQTPCSKIILYRIAIYCVYYYRAKVFPADTSSRTNVTFRKVNHHLTRSVFAVRYWVPLFLPYTGKVLYVLRTPRVLCKIVTTNHISSNRCIG